MSDFWRTLRRSIEVAVLGVAFTITGAFAVQAHDHDQLRDNADRAAAQAHFWRLVDGQGVGGTTVEAAFAEDLRALNTTGEVRAFRGDSNRYGGITEAIGYDPFDERGLNCFECGPLDSQTVRNVSLVRSGQLQVVLASVHVDYDDGYTLTPFGMGVPWAVLLGYLIIGNGSWLIAQWRTDVRVPTSDRRFMLIAPLVWAAQVQAGARSRHEVREQIEKVFPGQLAVVDEVDRELDDMPESDDKRALAEVRDQVFVELRRQSTRGARGRNNDRLKELFSKLQDTSSVLDAHEEIEALERMPEGREWR